MHEHVVIERLSAQDLITLWPDEVGSWQDMGALAVLEGSRLRGEDGGVRVDEVRAIVGGRLHLTPRLRQVIYTPHWGLGRPVWVDAPVFDVARHVKVHPVPPPGDETQLLATVEELRRRRLDPRRPLWEMWLLPGIDGGRIGLYLRVHHVIADGPAAAALLAAFLDAVPDVADQATASSTSWKPAAQPSARDLLADNAHRLRATLEGATATVAHPRVLLNGVRAAASAVRAGASAGLAPHSSLNRPIGPDRRFAVVRSDIDRIKGIAHRHDATVNDVLLTAVAGGLRKLLRSRGEPVEDLVLRAVVPIALPHRQRERAQGNVLGQMIVPLPLGEPDPDRLLRLIAAQTAVRKQRPSPRRLPVLRGRRLQRSAMRMAARQRAYNVYVANVHGPETSLYLAGALLLDVLPVVPILGNLTLGVGALSYRGCFAIVTVADRDTCPDLDVFSSAVDAALQSWSGADA
jgi:WS/DGAT/MGAT family acyltransferase